VLADMFNVFNLQRTIGYNNWIELQKGVTNPDFGSPTSQIVAGPQYQTPFQLRIGARFEF
jgi:hypothetical protein